MGVRIFPNRHVIYPSRSDNLGWSTWFCSDDFSHFFLFDLYLTKQNVSSIIDVSRSFSDPFFLTLRVLYFIPFIRSSKIDCFTREFAPLTYEPHEVYSFLDCFAEQSSQPGT